MNYEATIPGAGVYDSSMVNSRPVALWMVISITLTLERLLNISVCDRREYQDQEGTSTSGTTAVR